MRSQACLDGQVGTSANGSSARGEVRLCVCGAATDTTNLGVSALCYSALTGLAKRFRRPIITVFDNGWGVRPGLLRMGESEFHYTLCGGHHSRRLYRPESYWNMRLAWRLGTLWSSGARAMAHADAILDVSGGDSFCDLYGPKVFESNTVIKRAVLQHRKPLVLLPQTYGPFNSPRARQIATQIVRGAAMAWARDERSFQSLCALLGDEFDPCRHYCGVDLAFGLEAREPKEPPAVLSQWLQHCDAPVIGFNVSGLIYNDPEAALRRYGFKADYRRAVTEFLRRILRRTDCRVLLIPHVLTGPEYVESDSAACHAVAAELDGDARGRLFVLPSQYDPGETKSIISSTQWFCGTRMHSTIAGLSSGVPTAAIAYSLKTAGVFETCGQGDRVADPRVLATEEVVEHLWASWELRAEARQSLSHALPAVFSKVDHQLDRLAESLAQLAQRRESGGSN